MASIIERKHASTLDLDANVRGILGGGVRCVSFPFSAYSLTGILKRDRLRCLVRGNTIHRSMLLLFWPWLGIKEGQATLFGRQQCRVPGVDVIRG